MVFNDARAIMGSKSVEGGGGGTKNNFIDNKETIEFFSFHNRKCMCDGEN